MNIAYAATNGPATNLILKINDAIVNPIIYLMFGAALVVFLWGVKNYIAGSDNDEARAKGSQHIFWGLVGMTIMVASFSLIKVVLRTFGLYDADTKSQVEQIIK